MPKIMIPAIGHVSPKILTEKHNDEKLVITLLIVGAGLISGRKIKWHHYYLQSAVPW